MDLRSAIASPSSSNPYGTVGVDMAANPLTLGVKRLHSAVNLRFEEGAIKTRPGFRYSKLGVSGQFQGGLHYNPSKGLSARPFAPKVSALVVVVSGRLFVADASEGRLSCAAELCGTYDFACKGEVNLFQAENWLIVQNKLSDTFFWEGYGCLVKSPGMLGDVLDTDPVIDRSERPRLGKCWVTNTFVRFTVVDDLTNAPLGSALVQIYVGSRRDYTGTTNAKGRVSFHPVPKNYTYRVSLSGYLPVNAPLVVLANGTQFVDVRLTRDGHGGPGECDVALTSLALPVGGDVTDTASFTITNNGSVPLVITALEFGADPQESFTPELPLTLAPGASATFECVSTGDIRGTSYVITTSCGTFTGSFASE